MSGRNLRRKLFNEGLTAGQQDQRRGDIQLAAGVRVQKKIRADQCQCHEARCRERRHVEAVRQHEIVPEDLLLLAKADFLASLADENYRETEIELRGQLEGYRSLMAKPYVQAKDLLDAGMQPGPEIREAMAFLHKLQLSGVDREEALSQALGYMRSQHKSGGSEKRENSDTKQETGDH